MTRLVVVGGDAGGMAAAAEVRRRAPDMEIVALERGSWTSYSACGIPYLVGGEVAGIERLVARSAETFRSQGIDARTGHEVTAVDLDAGTVEVRDHATATTFTLGFDCLHLATGARPIRPDLPGISLPFVTGVQTLDDGANLLGSLQAAPAWAPDGIRRVVVVGAGYIGLEMAEAFLHRGLEVVAITASPEVLPTLDPDMGALVTAAMRDEGITVRCGEEVRGFEPGAVHTDGGVIPTDLVVLGIGVAPDTGLAAAAGLTTGVKGALVVDDHQRTSHAGVWSAGDCCQSIHRVTGQPVHLALGTVANKQGRVAGINLAGGDASFPGVVGTAVTKLCSLEIARTGLSEAEAERAGLRWRAVRIESTTRAGYFPGTGSITVKLVVAEPDGRLLGGQIIGVEGAAKRIDLLAACVTTGLTAQDLVDLDLSYAPPFSPVWDPLQTAARAALRAR